MNKHKRCYSYRKVARKLEKKAALILLILRLVDLDEVVCWEEGENPP